MTLDSYTSKVASSELNKRQCSTIRGKGIMKFNPQVKMEYADIVMAKWVKKELLNYRIRFCRSPLE